MGKALQQLSQQLLEAWKHLGISQRVSVLVTAVGVIAGLTVLILWASRPDYGLLYGKLSDGEIGALPADTVFYRAVHGEFDAVVAMYHDQGLAPFKLIAFDSVRFAGQPSFNRRQCARITIKHQA